MRQFSLLLLSILFSSTINAQITDSGEKTDNFLIEMYNNRFFNGTVLVAEKGKVVYHKNFGFANPETKEELSDIASFRLASVSKQFIGMGIMILQEKGKLNYDDPIQKYLPELPYKTVTIRNLLNHTGGLTDYMSLFEKNWDTETPIDDRKTAFNKDLVAMYAKMKPEIDFAPGEKYEYSNTGYVLLGEIIERVSGQPIKRFLQENIFDKADMTNTQAFSTGNDFTVKNRVYGFEYAPDGNRTIPNDWTFLNGMIGDGGIYASAMDMFHWSEGLATEKLVKKSTLQAAFQPAKLNDGTQTDYGFGWGLEFADDGHLSGIQHTGGWVGFRTFISKSFDEERTIILLSSNSTEAFGDLMRGVSTIWKGGEVTPTKPPITRKISELLAVDTDEKMLMEQFAKWQEKEADNYSFDERQINNLGYQYLGKQEIDKAIMVFKLNIKTYPESANAYDSLGEAYLENAKINYQKAYKMNPSNNFAKDILTKLDVLVEEESVDISEDILNKYVGKYQLTPNFIIAVTKEGKTLFVQATGQPKLEIAPLSKSKFYLKNVDAQVTFTEGAASLILHQGGMNQEAKRMKD